MTMIRYSYEAVDKQGRPIRGVIEEESAQSARHALRERGWVPMQVLPIAQPLETARRWLQRDIWRRPAIGESQRALLTRQLAELVTAGLPVAQALWAIAEESENKRQRKLLLDLHAQVQFGSSLAGALNRVPGEFNPVYRAAIAAGEAGGKLPSLLAHLARDLEAAQNLREKLISATVYPMMVGLVALGLLTFLLTAVVPQMAEVFVGRQKTLPLATVLLLQLSEGIRQFGLWILLALACLVLIAAQAFRREALRQRFDALLLRLPMLGAILQGYEVARFAATLALLIEAGLPLLRCLQTASATLGNRALRNDAEAAVRQVREGASLARALGSSARLPRLLVVFVRLGEQTGALAPMLDRVAQQISNQVQRRSMTLATVLEPVLITVLGGVVMFIVLAVLLPIISLQQLQL